LSAVKVGDLFDSRSNKLINAEAGDGATAQRQKRINPQHEVG
jgi:hypothetical protein